MLEHFSDSGFAGQLQANSVVLADFSATWCGPCRALTPVIEQIAADYAGKVLVGKIDVDDCPELAEKYAIMSVPTVMIFKDGQLVQKIVGVSPREAYTSVLDSLVLGNRAIRAI